MKNAKPVTIYTTRTCPFCIRAKALLARKDVKFEEIDVSSSDIREEMRLRSGGRNTVPQIFIGNTHIGGCDDIHALEAAGRLDEMLKS